MISSFGRIDSSKLRDGDMSEIDWNSFNHAVRAFEENTILIDETPSITPTEIRAKCRRLKKKIPRLRPNHGRLSSAHDGSRQV